MLEDLFANPAPRKGRGADYLFPAFWIIPNGGVGLDETLQVRLLLVQFQPAAPAGDLVEAQLAVGGVEGGTPWAKFLSRTEILVIQQLVNLAVGIVEIEIFFYYRFFTGMA